MNALTSDHTDETPNPVPVPGSSTPDPQSDPLHDLPVQLHDITNILNPADEDEEHETSTSTKSGFPDTFLINEDFFPKTLLLRLNAVGILLSVDKTKILSSLYDQVTPRNNTKRLRRHYVKSGREFNGCKG